MINGEWRSSCKDCGTPIHYSDASYLRGVTRGMSPPERCAACTREHNRQLSSMGLRYIDVVPISAIPPWGLKPGRLGRLSHPDREHIREDHPSVVPEGKFGIRNDLLVDYFRDLAKVQVSIIEAPTGSGKSTFFPYRLMVPPAGVDADMFTRRGQILVTQPRIEATRSIVEYVAHDLHGAVGIGPGHDIGFQTSEHRETDGRNRLVYMTDGSLINVIKRNDLNRVSVVMIDEAHERNLRIDLILALMRRELARYPHMKLIIASATIDLERFRTFYADRYEVLVASFPSTGQYTVEEEWWQDTPIPVEDWPRVMPDKVADTCFRVLVEMVENDGYPQGDVLAFLHGVEPIRQAQERLASLIAGDARLAETVVLPLHARLSAHDRNRALEKPKPGDPRRVIVSTNLAETSLTVEGIRHVVDSGLINQSAWDPVTLTGYIEAVPHSRSGLHQRRGRAGRVSSGIWHCLFTEAQFKALEPDTPAEIEHAPLEQVLLTAKAAGVDDLAALRWLPPGPPPIELARARRMLRRLDLTDADGDLTEHGSEVAAIRADLDVANLIVVADRFGVAIEAATVAAITELEHGFADVRRWDRGWDGQTKRDAHRAHASLAAACRDDVDLALRIGRGWDEAHDDRREWARRRFLDPAVLEGVARRRTELVDSLNVRKRSGQLRAVLPALAPRLRAVMAHALPANLYVREGGERETPRYGREGARYLPYFPDDVELDQARALHADAVVELARGSVVATYAADAFVAMKRQRMVRRLSPALKPDEIVNVSFVAALTSEALGYHALPPLALARTLRSQTSDSGPASSSAVEGHPVGAIFAVRDLGGQGHPIALGPLLDWRVAEERGSTTDTTDEQEVGLLDGEAETTEEIDELRALHDDPDETPDGHTSAGDPSETFGLSPADAPIADDDPAPGLAFAAPPGTEVAEFLLVRQPLASAGPQAGSRVVVIGHEYEDGRWRMLLEPDDLAERDRAFAARYKPGNDVSFEVEGVLEFPAETRRYLAVREPITQAEAVLDGFDLALDGQNHAVDLFEPGDKLKAEVEYVNRQTGHVHVSRLGDAAAALTSYLAKSPMIDAEIVEVQRERVVLWIRPVGYPATAPPWIASVLSRSAPMRPDEVRLGAKVKVSTMKPRRSQKRALRELPKRIEESLDHLPEREDLAWDRENQTLTVTGRMTNGVRRNLLSFADGLPESATLGYRRAINALFRASNRVGVVIFDAIGFEALGTAHASGEPFTMTVSRTSETTVFVSSPEIGTLPISAQNATGDDEQPLAEQFQVGVEVSVVLARFDAEKQTFEARLAEIANDHFDEYPVDTIVTATVKSHRNDGALVIVELPGRVKGILWADQVDRELKDATAECPIDSEVTCRVTKTDPDKREVELTVRRLYSVEVAVDDSQRRLLLDDDRSRMLEIEQASGAELYYNRRTGTCEVSGTDQAAVSQGTSLLESLLGDDPFDAYEVGEEHAGHVQHVTASTAWVQLEPGVSVAVPIHLFGERPDDGQWVNVRIVLVDAAKRFMKAIPT